MAYCAECGKELKNGAKFCVNCGTKVSQNEEGRREIVYEGSIHKCPNCGAPVKSFLTVCSECGFEFRDTESSNAIKMFSKKLELLESNRTSQTRNSLAEVFGIVETDPVDDQIINLISSFNVPNNKEDIFEFLILASSNINTSVISAHSYADLGLSSNADYSILVTKNNAWIAKLKQVYEKAKISFGNDADFLKIKELYERTSQSIQKAKKQRKRRSIKVWIAVLIIVLPMALFYPIKAIIREVQVHNLEHTVTEIKEDIKNGDYDSAYIKVQTLHAKDGWSDQSKWYWDEQRETLIKLIEDMSGKKYTTTKQKSTEEDTYYSLPTVDLKDLNVEAVYPMSDYSSKLFNGIQLAPELIYHTLRSENKLGYTPYVVTGKVIKTGNGSLEMLDYFNAELNEDEENLDFFWFIIENEFGKVLIQDSATYTVKSLKDNLANGNLKMDNWTYQFANEFGGYGKYEYPKEGETVAILGIYVGYSQRLDIANFYFGINEMYRELLIGQ